MQSRTLPDYPSVIKLAEAQSGTRTAVWLTTLNVAIARETAGSDELQTAITDYFCIDGFPLLRLLRRFLPNDATRTTGVDLVS